MEFAIPAEAVTAAQGAAVRNISQDTGWSVYAHAVGLLSGLILFGAPKTKWPAVSMTAVSVLRGTAMDPMRVCPTGPDAQGGRD